MTIRKEGKARWVYECQPCGYTSPVSPDLFRAQESQLRHSRAAFFAHFAQTFADAFRPVVEFVEKFAASEFFQDDFVLVPPPLNKPHDPSLLKDRRKWGGR